MDIERVKNRGYMEKNDIYMERESKVTLMDMPK